MKIEKKEKLPIFSYTDTPSFTKADQLINSTDNELFSFKDGTVKESSNVTVFQPFAENEKKTDKSR